MFLDIIAQSKSGTGKTLAFGIPALESLKPAFLGTQILVLSPTRELASQTHSVLTELGRHKKGLHCHCFIGGLSYNADIAKLSPCNVVVGTPGRIIQLINDGFLLTSSLHMFILDEADKMLQEGALKLTTMEIMKTLPSTVQHVCVSATYTPEMLTSLESIIPKPEKVMLAAGNPTLEGVKQYYLLASEQDSSDLARLFAWKTAELIRVLRSLSFHQCIVFSNASTRSSSLVEKLNANGWPSTAISGVLTQTERNKAMEDLRDFKTRILVSSDLVARGLDIDRINLVINLDMPYDAETYLHRVGRTGRFGTLGVAISILGRSELSTLTSYLSSYASNLSELPDEIPSDLYDFELNEKDQQAKAALEETGATLSQAAANKKDNARKGKRSAEAREIPTSRKNGDQHFGNSERPPRSSSSDLVASKRGSKVKRRQDAASTHFGQLNRRWNGTGAETNQSAPQPPFAPDAFTDVTEYYNYITYMYIPQIQALFEPEAELPTHEDYDFEEE